MNKLVGSACSQIIPSLNKSVEEYFKVVRIRNMPTAIKDAHKNYPFPLLHLSFFLFFTWCKRLWFHSFNLDQNSSRTLSIRLSIYLSSMSYNYLSISISQPFLLQEEHQVNLKFPLMPCLHLGSITKTIYIPAELCFIDKQALPSYVIFHLTSFKCGSISITDLYPFLLASPPHLRTRSRHMWWSTCIMVLLVLQVSFSSYFVSCWYYYMYSFFIYIYFLYVY